MKQRAVRVVRIVCFLIMMYFLFVPLRGVHAEDKKGSEENPMGFTVETIIPENQVDLTKTYFYLGMEPNQKQTVQVKIRSLKEEPVTVKLAIHDAVSSSSGAIDYTQVNPKLDESLKDPITSLAKIVDNVKEVTVKNFEEKTIEYEITTPSKKFPGVKLGSLRFVKKSTDKGKQKGLVPEYARVVAIMLTEDGEKFNQGADLHLKKVNLKLSNGQKVIAARIQNDQPKVIQELSINGKVKKKGSKSTVASQKVKDFSVAPNSNFDFEIPLSIKKFGAGTYEFTGVASANGKKWNWKKEFTVGNEQAKKVNEESVYKLRTPSWAPIVTVALIVSLIGLIAFLIRRQSIWTKRGL